VNLLAIKVEASGETFMAVLRVSLSAPGNLKLYELNLPNILSKISHGRKTLKENL
jgi:hypothetical protein